MIKQESTVRTPEEIDAGTDIIFTVPEFAQVLRCSPRTVSRRISDGTIRKMAGLGRLVRIHSSEIPRLACPSAIVPNRGRARST